MRGSVVVLVAVVTWAQGEDVSCEWGLMCASGKLKEERVLSREQEEEVLREYYANATHYDEIHGSDNLHFGYFPHLASTAPSQRPTPALSHGLSHRPSQRQAASALTEKMVEMAGVRQGMRVLDLGSGKGRACVEIAQWTGASCVGLDLTPEHVLRSDELAKASPELDLEFVLGSFTDLPKQVLDKGPFDVVFSQGAFCHVHARLDTVFQQAKKVMRPTSLLVVNDMLGSDDPYHPDTREHVFRRLHFQTLYGPILWRKTADAAGLVLQQYLNLDAHLRHAFADMARQARHLGINSTDGTPLVTSYLKSAEAVSRRQIGMNLAIYTL